MTTRPILFSAPMVRALLDGRKSMTRRVLKPQPDFPPNQRGGIGFSMLTPSRHYEMRGWTEAEGPLMRHRPLPFWSGDLLWVRESLRRDRMANFLTGERTTNAEVACYRADDTDVFEENGFNAGWIWARSTLPAIRMPRWASRLTLEVRSVKVERLQDISKADVIAEGITEHDGMPIEGCVAGWHEPFAELWESINGAGSWDSNPWVVALTFVVHKLNVDKLLKQREAA